MIEIIAIITLGKTIRGIISEKGLKPWKYILLMVVLWLGFEIIGFIIAGLILGESLISYLFAIAGAALGGYLSYRIALNAEPAQMEYDISEFGKED
ncbi:MAG: hypothetical protein ABFS32_14330 [Bacteroidota bacterium]